MPWIVQEASADIEQDAPLARVAKEASLPLRTAQHRVSRYRRFGLVGGLTRTGRSDQGKRQRVPEDLLRPAEGLALQRPPFSPSAVYREVCRVARARGEQPLGYHTIYNVIRGKRSVKTPVRQRRVSARRGSNARAGGRRFAGPGDRRCGRAHR